MMSEPITQHEQIRHFIATRFPDLALTDADIESIAAMPVVTHLCERELPDVNILLRTLPRDLLDHMHQLASEMSEWDDLKDPSSWPNELFTMAVILSGDEVDADEERRIFRLGLATARLAAQAFIECARRAGIYSFFEDYTLSRSIRTAPRLENFTEH